MPCALRLTPIVGGRVPDFFFSDGLGLGRAILSWVCPILLSTRSLQFRCRAVGIYDFQIRSPRVRCVFHQRQQVRVSAPYLTGVPREAYRRLGKAQLGEAQTVVALGWHLPRQSPMCMHPATGVCAFATRCQARVPKSSSGSSADETALSNQVWTMSGAKRHTVVVKMAGAMTLV